MVVHPTSTYARFKPPSLNSGVVRAYIPHTYGDHRILLRPLKSLYPQVNDTVKPPLNVNTKM